MTFRIDDIRPRARSRALPTGAALGAVLLLAACGGNGAKVASTPPPPTASADVPVTPGMSPQQRYEHALSLLQQGQEAQAKAELDALHRDRPTDRRANTLLAQIGGDPKQLYGADSFAYQVQAGDTLFSLAKRYLRDPLNFYGLARYNGLSLPAEIQPGQTILIPGHPRAPERTPVTAPGSAAPAHRPAPATSGPAEPRQPTPPPPPPQAAPEAAKREQAQALRRQGLEQMSAGSIDRAVALLGQAAALDPQNGAIGADLARARRIQATVHSH